MDFRRRLAQIDLAFVLLVAVVVELALDRLAVPVLRPGKGVPPRWHQFLDFVGLYTFHLASLLALAAVGTKAWMLARRRDLLPIGARVAVGLAAAAVMTLAAWRVLGGSSQRLGFPLESSFTGLMLMLALAVAVRPGGARPKLGLVLLCVPFVIHYYGTFTLRMLMPAEQAQWSSLPDRVRELGTWSLALVAINSPLLFAPRPLRASLVAPGPLGLGLFVGLVAAVVLRRYYDVGMEIAARGFGVEIAPGAPPQVVAVYVTALAAVTMTLAATLAAPSLARRKIGVGFALMVASGYAFVWPLQFLAAAAGAFAIVEGALAVDGEEEAERVPERRFQVPPIPAATWIGYVSALRQALGAEEPESSHLGDREVTSLRGKKGTLPFRVVLTRQSEAVASIDIVWGDPPESDPAWTMAARAEGILAAGSHPPPPRTKAPALAKVGDAPFDRRFRVNGSEVLTGKLLDDGLRAAASAVLDGWLAVWPGQGLRYQVCPGRGAPLDHPVPVTELAFRAESEPHGTEKLVTVSNLLGEIAERASAASG
jgi:hypothetical protein